MVEKFVLKSPKHALCREKYIYSYILHSAAHRAYYVIQIKLLYEI